MKSKEEPWSMRDAEWWQFWMPQSGAVGGLLAGTVVGVILVIIEFRLK